MQEGRPSLLEACCACRLGRPLCRSRCFTPAVLSAFVAPRACSIVSCRQPSVASASASTALAGRQTSGQAALELSISLLNRKNRSAHARPRGWMGVDGGGGGVGWVSKYKEKKEAGGDNSCDIQLSHLGSIQKEEGWGMLRQESSSVHRSGEGKFPPWLGIQSQSPDVRDCHQPRDALSLSL